MPEADLGQGDAFAPDNPEIALADGAARSTRLPRLLRALRHRNYRLFISGQAVSQTGSWMQQVAMSWLLLEITQPETRALWLGIVAATGAVPGLVFSLIAGAVADRVRKRDLIVITQACAMVLAFVLAAVTHAELATIPLVIGIAFLSGSVNAFDAPTRQSFVIEMVGREDLPHAIALNSAMFNGARMLGPAVAGWVIAALGLASAFLLNGVSFIAVIAGLLLMRLPPRASAVERGTGGSLRDGLRYIRGNRFVLALLTQSAVLNVFAASYATLLPMYARDLLGAEVGEYGHLVSLIGIGAILGALTLSATGGARPSLLLCGASVLCAAIAGISFAPTLTVAMCIMPAIGWGMMINMASTNTLIQFSVPDEMRGRAISAYTLTFMGMAPLGGLQAGAVAQALGVPVTLRIGAAISACAVLLLARRILRGGRGAA